MVVSVVRSMSVAYHQWHGFGVSCDRVALVFVVLILLTDYMQVPTRGCVCARV